jgi:hypothetical protein
MPGWFQGDILDIRTVILDLLHATQTEVADSEGISVARVWCPCPFRGIVNTLPF